MQPRNPYHYKARFFYVHIVPNSLCSSLDSTQLRKGLKAVILVVAAIMAVFNPIGYKKAASEQHERLVGGKIQLFRKAVSEQPSPIIRQTKPILLLAHHIKRLHGRSTWYKVTRRSKFSLTMQHPVDRSPLNQVDM